MAMKRTMTVVSVVVAVAGSFCLTSTFHIGNTSLVLRADAQSLRADSEQCTTASFQGTYVYRRTGFNNDVGPIAGVGTFTADGEGNLSGSGTKQP